LITKKLEPISEDSIKIEKSIYDPRGQRDGARVLVMRLWPRGVKKEKIDTWMKELGCERDLIRAWKSNAISREEFRKRYLESIRGDPVKRELLKELSDQLSRGRTITLLCSCKDPRVCHRSFIKEELLGRIQ